MKKSNILRSRVRIFCNGICNLNNDDVTPMGNLWGNLNNEILY